MEINPETIKRLSFIKYFYQFAKEQSKLPTHQNYISILMFHDSVELFLYLSAEQLNVNLPHYIHFMEYWEKINNKLNGKELTQRTSMDKLNRTRVSLKHKGLYPNPDDIEYFRVSTQNFFEENCPKIFGIEFANISLLDLIQDDEVRKILENAHDFYINSKYKEALTHIGIAFHALLENYKKSTSIYGKSPFDIGENLDFIMFDWNMENRELGKISNTVKAIQKILEPIILNLDYRRYLKFRFLTPIFILNGDEYYDKYHIIWATERDKNDIKKENVEYCIKFIIESALKLQEFDLEIDDGKFLYSLFR